MTETATYPKGVSDAEPQATLARLTALFLQHRGKQVTAPKSDTLAACSPKAGALHPASLWVYEQPLVVPQLGHA
jgi:hypothetical protein